MMPTKFRRRLDPLSALKALLRRAGKAAEALRKGAIMTPAEFRAKAIDLIEDALGHHRFVRGDNRALLEGMVKYLQAANDEQLKDLQKYMVFR